MTTMRRVLLLVIIIASFISGGSTFAGTVVEFSNLPGREPAHLVGYLARPGVGLSALLSTTRGDPPPYPAVVVLLGCGGISSHSAAIADQLGGWGYVALTIDTLGHAAWMAVATAGPLWIRRSTPMLRCAICQR